MAFIDCVEWQPQSNDVFAWRYPEQNLSTATQLIVRKSQEAVFFSKGQILGKFGPGKHTLSTENLPILHNLFGIPFGKKNPFTAEVWFVNKAAPLTIDWNTTSVRIMDADYGQMLPIVAKGRYGVKIKDAEKFLVKLVGTLTAFDSAQLTDHFMGPLVAKTNSAIVTYMTANQVGVMQIAAYLDQLSTFISEPLKQFWDEYGLELTGFYVTSVDLDTSTPDGKKIADAMSDRSAQNIAGYTWQQKQSFGTVNNAVQNSRGGIGMIGAAMMMGGGMNGNPGMGSAMMTPNGNGNFARQGGSSPVNQKSTVFCSRCGKSFPSSNKFCPHCGDPYNPCPVCGRDNEVNAKRCAVCGASLQGQNTVNGMMNANACSRCGTTVPAGTKFCPNCGNRL
ncbi:SPFH domain-containing protein [uncultured Treponema sp.]|uniref:SPFH domain-containing protein n=1 Tax=uncultured Treponema sp. TaxID=162155 RepID=UPI0015BE20E2|nr:SPFH domain-containing protein [uncultured Treponema sp.]